MDYVVKDLLTLREKEINSYEYGIVMSHLEALKKFSCEIDYYKLVDISIREYLLLQNKIQVNTYDNFVVLNSKYANWLNAFYMWLQYHKKEYNYETENMITLCTKENVEFNLARELRNHVIHDAFAISLISFDVLKEEACYLIKPSDILRQNTNSTLKIWLNDRITKNENIDSIFYLRQFSEVFNELQIKIWNKLLPENMKRVNECCEILRVEGADIRNSVIKDGIGSCMAGHILNEILEKMQIATILARKEK